MFMSPRVSWLDRIRSGIDTPSGDILDTPPLSGLDGFEVVWSLCIAIRV